MTTEDHIAEFVDAYQKAEPAALIRDFEDMEKRGLELPIPYNYKVLQVTKQTWGRNALIAGCLGLVALLVAAVLSRTGRNTMAS